jgi:peptidyl-prolyl cis-trans isomerase C
MISSRRARFAAFLLGGAAILTLGAMPLLAQTPAKEPDQNAAQAAPQPAKPTGAAAATVNGTPITEDDLSIAEIDLGGGLPQQMTPEQKREYLTSYSVDLKLVADEAEKQKVVDDADIAKRLAYYRKKILMEQLLTKAAKDAVTDEAMKKLYDETAKSVAPEEEIHARHILLENEDDAKKAHDRVVGGEDFAKVAKELSKDPGSSDGGDLGWFTKDRMVKEFSDAAFTLKPGEVSQPVKSQFGWHVIKVEERRQKPIPTFDQVKPQIANFLTRKSQQDLILKLRSEAKIERPDAPPATVAPSAADPGPAATGPKDGQPSTATPGTPDPAPPKQ